MPGHTDANTDLLTRSEVYSSQLKEVLLDELQATGYVDWMTEFPDGDTFTIPSIGQATVRDYVENEPVVYDALDTGEFQFTITEYLDSSTYITDKQKQDAFYADRLIASFVPQQKRAIMEHVETNIFALQSSQTASDLNNINGAAHRFVGGGSGGRIAVEDFAKALYGLKKARVPSENLIAIVDPSVEYAINTLTNIVNVSNNPMWEGVIDTGIAKGMRFVKNIFGFDVFTSDYLADDLTETIDGAALSGDGVANMFFSASSDVMPFVGAWRQMPRVSAWRDDEHKRDVYSTDARYGTKLFRPENLIVCLTKQAL